MENTWNVILFGGLEATWNRQPIHFATRRTAAVFAFLAYHRGKVFPRDTLAEKFWPDNNTEAARNSLRVALSHLRKHVEPNGVTPGSILVANRSTVSLSSHAVATDVMQFHHALTLEANASDTTSKIQYLLTAVELYRGLLLQGWYDEWIYPEQAQLAETYVAVLGRLTDLLRMTGELERALEFARRAVQVEPLREANHKRLIEMYAVVGRHEAALQQYRELERVFRQELDVEPARSTRELMERIHQDREQQVTPSETPCYPAYSEKTPQPPASGPQWFTSFYGREVELQFLQDALKERNFRVTKGQLLTLVGPGGIGKTRLVVEAATRLWHSEFPGRVFMVELSDAISYAQFPATVVNALGLAVSDDATPIDSLIAVFSESPSLLILDGVDPLVEGASHAIQMLRTALPRLLLIVTARQPLGLAGERIITVPPLMVTPSRVRISPEKLSGWPSVQLFMDRAQAVRPDFKLTAENAPAIAALSSRLDGLPLAIELAAAWVHLLSPSEILKRLDARFDLLVSQSQAVPQRHRSLRVVMDETCRMLPPNVAKFFASLSVFRGGWTFEAAQHLCEDTSALEYLSVLQQRSLILATEIAGSIRFRMLETVREYARTLIKPDAYQKCQRLHAQYYGELAERLGPKANCPSVVSVLAQLEIEQENFRAALHRCLGPLNEPLLALRIGASLWRLWYSRGVAEQGMSDLTAALNSAGSHAPIAVRLRALEGAGRLALSLGQFSRACGFFRNGMELASRDKDHPTGNYAILVSNLAVAAKANGDAVTAREAFTTLLSLKTRAHDHWGMAYVFAELSKVSKALGDREVARSQWEESHQLLLMLGEISDESSSQDVVNEERVAQALMRVGFLASEQGDHATAIPLLEDALASFRRAGSPCGIAIALERLGLAAFRCEDWDRAQKVLEEALSLRREGIGSASTTFPHLLLTEVARHTSDSYSLKHLLYTDSDASNNPEHVK